MHVHAMPAAVRRRPALNLTKAQLGVLCCTLSMTVLGASVPITRAFLTYPAATGQALRYGLAAAVLAPIAVLTRRNRLPLSQRDWALLAAVAATGLVAFNFFLMTALRHAEPAAVATILGCAPIVMALAGPLLNRQPPSARILTAATIVAAGTMLLNGIGHLDPAGIVFTAAALAADMAFTLLAAPLIPKLGPVTVAALTCGVAVPMFATAATVNGELSQLRAPDGGEAAAIVFLGVVLTAGAFVSWFHGIRLAGVASAGITIGAIPVAALTVASLQSWQLPNAAQQTGLAGVLCGLWLAVHKTAPAIRLQPNLRPIAAVAAIIAVAGCGPSQPRHQQPGRPATTADTPERPVREYFAALEARNMTAAYALSRSTQAWLTTDALAAGYQPPSAAQVITVSYNQPSTPEESPRLAYVRMRYHLGGQNHDSTVEVWQDQTGTWWINSGATGRLDVISPSSPKVKIANAEVATTLTTPRISGGQPSAGFFELPPGVYTVTLAAPPALRTEPQQIAVPAMWRDGAPVSVQLSSHAEGQPPRPCSADSQAPPAALAVPRPRRARQLERASGLTSQG